MEKEKEKGEEGEAKKAKSETEVPEMCVKYVKVSKRAIVRVQLEEESWESFWQWAEEVWLPS